MLIFPQPRWLKTPAAQRLRSDGAIVPFSLGRVGGGGRGSGGGVVNAKASLPPAARCHCRRRAGVGGCKKSGEEAGGGKRAETSAKARTGLVSRRRSDVIRVLTPVSALWKWSNNHTERAMNIDIDIHIIIIIIFLSRARSALPAPAFPCTSPLTHLSSLRLGSDVFPDLPVAVFVRLHSHRWVQCCGQ